MYSNNNNSNSNNDLEDRYNRTGMSGMDADTGVNLFLLPNRLSSVSLGFPIFFRALHP